MHDFTLIADGEEFEMFCEDLLKARRYILISCPSRGPDKGCDMILTYTYTDELGFIVDMRVLVECKHFAKSGRSVREGDIGNVVERVFANNCNGYLLITSTIPSSSVAHQLQGISNNPSIPISASFWAKNDLENLLSAFPQLEKKYFSDKREIGLSETSESDNNRWNIILHKHPDFSDELMNIIKLWNNAQDHFSFVAVKPTRYIDSRLLSHIEISEKEAAEIANSLRHEAGFNRQDEIIQFCEGTLSGDRYYHLLAAGTSHEEEPPNTATISLEFMRYIAKSEEDGEIPIFDFIIQALLHVVSECIGIEAHDETRGCIMDFDENMTDILLALKDGPKYCPACETQVKRIGANYILDIVNQTKDYLSTQEKSDDVSTRMKLRDKRKEKTGEDWTYDIAISYAGEDRDVVEKLVLELQKKDVKVFYDSFEKAELWGKDLYSYLSDLYRFRAKFCVIFVSQHYANKLWTNHERKAAQARAFTENLTYLLPIRLDDTDIPGLLNTIGYIRWQSESVENIAGMIVQKIKKDG